MSSTEDMLKLFLPASTTCKYLLLCVQFSGFIHTLEPVVNFADFVDLQLIRVVKSGTVLATEFNAKIYFMRITDRLRISPYSMSV